MMQDGIQRTDRNLPSTREYNREDTRGVERLREDIGDELLALERGDETGDRVERCHGGGRCRSEVLCSQDRGLSVRTKQANNDAFLDLDHQHPATPQLLICTERDDITSFCPCTLSAR